MTHPTISQKAVEAAARACYEHEPLERDDFVEIPWDGLGQGTRYRFMHKARATVTAALAVDGLVLVPQEPTEEMLDAGACYEFQDRHIVDDGDISRDVYRAMLSAAPTGTEG